MILTIFTPTYNRAHLLPRLYESLCGQANLSFEWLVVDDGSTDETAELVTQMAAERKIKIRYIKKENGGKHTAHNTALQHAAGEWFMCLDSDDVLAPDAVQKIVDATPHLSDTDCGFIAYKALADYKKLSGELPPEQSVRRNIYEYSQLVGGEFVFVFLTDLIRAYPYPVVPGERFAGECIVYDRLDLNGYTICPLPMVLEICEYQSDGLSSSFYRHLTENPTGYQIYHAQRMDLVDSRKTRMRHAICYQAFRRLSKNQEYYYQGKHKALAALAWLPGQLGALYYKKKGT